MKIFHKQKNTNGFSVIEVIIACSIISISVFTLMSVAQKGIQLSEQALRQTEANMLLEEGAESVKSIRDGSWTTISNLTIGTTYYLFFNTNTNTWSLNTSLTTPANSIPTYPVDNIFSRTVVLSAVNRNASDDIADAGTLDTRTKKVTVQVSWPSSDGVKTKSLTFYITDLFT